MDISRDFPLDRRQFMAGAGFALLGGCTSCPKMLTVAPGAPAAALGDAHVHFFNLSDLPARGFIRHVLLPERAPGTPPVGAALADFFARILKPLAPSVWMERRGLYLSLIENIPDRHISSARYADLLSTEIEHQARASTANPARGGDFVEAWEKAGEASLPDSYFALGALLNSLDPDKTLDSAPFTGVEPGPVDQEQFERAIRVDRSFLARIAEGDWNEAAVKARDSAFAPPPAAVSGNLCPERAESSSRTAEDILQLLQWGLEMLQSRCSHVRKYIHRTGTRAHEPKLMVNLLVDYDRWLDDRPSGRSSHDAQVRFWSDFAGRYAGEVEIRTLAGFDPLKLAEQRLIGEPVQFDRLKTYVLNGRPGGSGPACHGFKVYPPMGFQAVDNAALDFDGPERAQKIVGERWRNHPDLRSHRVGEKIDEALSDLYDFCIDNRVPVMTHAGPGNAAACGYGRRAHPKHWLALVSRQGRSGLRLCIGHLVDDARKFIAGMNAWDARRPVDAEVWALHGTHEMLRRSQTGQADVYADLGFLSDLLKGTDDEARALSVAFFDALKRYCLAFDPQCRRVLFGSDWIMLGHERNYHRYTALMEHGTREAGWPEAWRPNFFGGNLRRFLNLPAASAAAPAPAPGFCRI